MLTLAVIDSFNNPEHIIYADDSCYVLFDDRGGDTVTITFSGWTSMPERLPLWRDNVRLAKQSGIFIVAKQNHFYDIESINPLLDIIRDLRRRFTKAILMGISMGGYAAIRFSAQLNATTVIAFSPFFSVSSRILNFDKRWGTQLKDPKRSIDSISPLTTVGEIFILYDPLNREDCAHAKRIAEEINCTEIQLHNAGHPASQSLTELKEIYSIFSELNHESSISLKLQGIYSKFIEERQKSAIIVISVAQYMEEEARTVYLRKVKTNKQNFYISNFKSDLFEEILASVDPDEADTLYLHALDYEKQGDSEKALQIYKQSLALKEHEAYRHFQYARLLSKMQQWTEAVEQLKIAIACVAEHQPCYSAMLPDWYYRLAEACQKLKDHSELALAYEKGLSLDETRTTIDEKALAYRQTDFIHRRRFGLFIEDHLYTIRTNTINFLRDKKETTSDKIFFYWAQGIDKAPDLVKFCHSTLLKNNQDRPVITLSDATIGDYVELPSVVFDKHNRGFFTKSQFADVLRVALLTEHGGCWVDATCLCTESLSRHSALGEKGFFAFRYPARASISSWFLISKQYNYIATMMREALYEYCKIYDRPFYYYFFHAIFESLYIQDFFFQKKWDSTPSMSTYPPHELQNSFSKPYEIQTFNKMINNIFIHKLTYKFDSTKILSATNLHHLLNLGKQKQMIQATTKNIAPGKKACVSSLSPQWSRDLKDPQKVLTGDIINGYAFHTAKELNPWLLIDLEKIFAVDRIIIHNREGFEDRCQHMVVSISHDAIHWKSIYDEKKLFGGKYNNRPCEIYLDNEIIRFIRIEKKGFGFLHLSQVEVIEKEQRHSVSHGVLLNYEEKQNIFLQHIVKLLDENRYEATELGFALENINESDTILELGAGLGFISSVILRYVKLKSYTAVEANPMLIEIIKNVHKINNINNCELIHAMVTTSQQENSTFYLRESFLASSFTPGNHCSEVEVKTISFKSLIESKKPTFLICDIEGAEHEILHTDLTSISKICLELHGSQEKIDKTVTMLQNKGFITEQAPKEPISVAFFYQA